MRSIPTSLFFTEKIVLLVVDTNILVGELLRQRGRDFTRDPDDWPTVALAIALDAAIWTHDCDFLG